MTGWVVPLKTFQLTHLIWVLNGWNRWKITCNERRIVLLDREFKWDIQRLCRTNFILTPYAYLWPEAHRANKLRPPEFPSLIQGMKNLSSSTNWQLNATSRPTNPNQPQEQPLVTGWEGRRLHRLNDLARLVSVVKFNLTYNSECPATKSLASN